jgi:uroporphyrin-III C-methyltransferase/precorrin-2 dehydrogenase/sirohydrochlorin ferrochelatase
MAPATISTTQALLQQADVVVYDRLIPTEVLDMARRDAEKIYAGKQRDNHSLPLESINQLLIDLALAGKSVAD